MYEKLPNQLKEREKFCLWSIENRNGGKTKVPYTVSGRRADSTKADDFCDYETAVMLRDKYDGIGIGVFGDIIAIDIDHCYENGEFTDMAKDIIKAVDSYTEFSPSGRGVRIIARNNGLIFNKEKYYINNRKNRLEVYVAGFTSKFVTVTGNAINNKDVMPRCDEIQQILDKYMLRPQTEKTTAQAPGSSLSDDSVIQKAMSAKNGDAFSRLWNGDISGYGSHSEADLALMCHLAFYSGGDEEQMIRLFENSGLMRDKFNRQDYRESLIKKAVSGCREFYSPVPVSSAEEDFNPLSAKLDMLDYINNTRYKSDDIGCGRLLADVFKPEARYVPERKSWFVYDGRRWIQDVGGLTIMEIAKRLADAVLIYALKIKDEDKRTQYIKSAGKWQQRKYRETYIKEAQSVYPVSAEVFDSNPLLFNCQNGTFDLKSMSFREHSPEDFITKTARVKYDPNAESDKFLKFIDEIMCGDESLAGFLQKCSGSSLAGENPYEFIVLLYGPLSRNGKSTFTEVMLYLFGDYGAAVSPETLAQKFNTNSHGPTEDIARLAGIRFANVAEPPKGMALNAAQVKLMSGNDTITARFLNEKSFDFKPQFKLFFNTNYLPVVNDPTVFSSDRVIIIPFNRHFTEQERNINLKKELTEPEVQSAVLNWLIEGYRFMQQEGLNKPQAVVESINEYSRESNKTKQFFDECMREEPGSEVKTTDVYDSYRQWCNANGCHAENHRNFLHELKRYARVERQRPKGGGEKTTLVIDCSLLPFDFL